MVPAWNFEAGGLSLAGRPPVSPRVCDTQGAAAFDYPTDYQLQTFNGGFDAFIRHPVHKGEESLGNEFVPTHLGGVDAGLLQLLQVAACEQ